MAQSNTTPQPVMESAVDAIFITKTINGKQIRVATTPQDFADQQQAFMDEQRAQNAELIKALNNLNAKLDTKADAVPATANPPAVQQPPAATGLTLPEVSHAEACKEAGLVPSFGHTLGFGKKMVSPETAKFQAWGTIIGVGVGAAVVGGFIGYLAATCNSDSE